MPGLDFFADVVGTGEVLGVDAMFDPGIVAKVLGEEFTEVRWHEWMWRDYGLVEFHWTERPRGRGWLGHHFTVQAHRLSREPNQIVGDAIRARYGQFEHGLRLADLRAELERREIVVIELAAEVTGSPQHQYWCPGTGALTTVDARVPETVWALTAPVAPEVAIPRRYWDRRKAFVQALNHVVRLSDSQRLDWIARKAPDGALPVWWLNLCRLIRARARNRDRPDDREAWITFYLWALRQGRNMGAFTDVVAASEQGTFVSGLDDVFPDEFGSWAAVLPTADEIVRACLDAIPDDVDRVRSLGRVANRLRPESRKLIDAARLHADRVQDARLTEELRGWTAVRLATSAR